MEDKNISNNMIRWEFNDEVTKCFDEMLERSIPDYYTMRELVNSILVDHINSNQLMHTNIIDLGCSRGGAIKLASRKLHSNHFLGIECSKPMLKAARNEFRLEENVDIINMDLRNVDELPRKNCGAILSVLTLQFIPIEYRQKIVQQVYDSLNPKGIFIFVEKILGNTSLISENYEKWYYKRKYQQNYSYEEIRDKKLKLEGVLVPATERYNYELLSQAGFKHIDVFWKYLNFVGFIAYK